MPKHYLVTGASSGIGKAITEALLLAGHHVIVLGRRKPQWTDSDRLEFVEVDLSCRDRTAACLKMLKKRQIGFDGVVSNAGQGVFGQLESHGTQTLYSAIDLNLTAHILLARALLPDMKRRGHGCFVFIGSEAALQGAKNGAVYCATKFALRGLAQSLRADVASNGVRVSIVHPGMVDTAFFDELWFRPGTETGQHLTAQDVARTVMHVLDGPDGLVIDEVSVSAQVKVVKFDRKTS
jgi:3-hydroxy acid dehydrogenase / malonic semialdehyde reductase